MLPTLPEEDNCTQDIGTMENILLSGDIETCKQLHTKGLLTLEDFAKWMQYHSYPLEGLDFAKHYGYNLQSLLEKRVLDLDALQFYVKAYQPSLPKLEELRVSDDAVKYLYSLGVRTFLPVQLYRLQDAEFLQKFPNLSIPAGVSDAIRYQCQYFLDSLEPEVLAAGIDYYLTLPIDKLITYTSNLGSLPLSQVQKQKLDEKVAAEVLAREEHTYTVLHEILSFLVYYPFYSFVESHRANCVAWLNALIAYNNYKRTPFASLPIIEFCEQYRCYPSLKWYLHTLQFTGYWLHPEVYKKKEISDLWTQYPEKRSLLEKMYPSTINSSN